MAEGLLMPIVTCPEYDGRFSHSASFRPHCGDPNVFQIIEDVAKIALGVGLIVGIIWVIVVVFLSFSLSGCD